MPKTPGTVEHEPRKTPILFLSRTPSRPLLPPNDSVVTSEPAEQIETDRRWLDGTLPVIRPTGRRCFTGPHARHTLTHMKASQFFNASLTARQSVPTAVRARRIAAFILGVVLAGCSEGGSVATNVRRPATQRPDIDRAQTASGVLALPKEQPYNVVSFKSGQSGEARGESKAVGSDGVTCRAEGEVGGSAWGEFQLGYCFDNVTGDRLNASVRLKTSVTESVSLRPGATGTELARGASTAAVKLTFFIKDTNGLVVRSEDLLNSSLETGPHSTTNVHDLIFDASFEPQRGYYLVLAGRVDAEAAENQKVSASLAVAGCLIDIRWQAEEASAATADPAPEKAPAG